METRIFGDSVILIDDYGDKHTFNWKEWRELLHLVPEAIDEYNRRFL